jgi:hypothetical protein
MNRLTRSRDWGCVLQNPVITLIFQAFAKSGNAFFMSAYARLAIAVFNKVRVSHCNTALPGSMLQCTRNTYICGYLSVAVISTRSLWEPGPYGSPPSLCGRASARATHIGPKRQRHAIDAVAQARRPRTILESVP